MKWIALVLVLVNAGYLGWQLQRLELPPTEARPVDTEEPDYVNRLLLLSEVDRSQLRERRPPIAVTALAQDTAADVTASPDVPVGLCYSVGPLAEIDEIDRMRDWLLERGGAARLRTDEVRELSLYWVFFPPFATRVEALERVEAMRAQGMSDIYIIPRGDQANAISLGVYSRRQSLDRRVRELRGFGYSPDVAPRYRTKRASWFDVAFPDDFEFPQDSFGDLFPTVEMSPTACRGGPIAADQRLPYNSLGSRERGDQSATGDSGEAPRLPDSPAKPVL